MRIKLEKIKKVIKGVSVLDDISFEFESGKIYGIVGRNGSGKTMLLRMISGLIKPTEGIICVENQQLWKDIDFPPEVGLIIEKPVFIEYLSGYDNLKLIAEIKGITTNNEIEELMKAFSLDPESKQIMKKYSLGMKQKIGIIQAIMESPKLLVLDEPFNALDQASVLLLRNKLIDMKLLGAIVIITSHNMEDINSVCDVILKMEEGKVVGQEQVKAKEV